MDESKALTIPKTAQYLKSEAKKGKKERIQVLNYLHNFKKLSPYLIGDILLDWEQTIKWNYKKAKEYQEKTGKQGKLPPKNLYQEFQQNPNQLEFDYKEAKHYITYRLDRELNYSESKKDVPLAHNIVIRKIKDKELRENLRLQVIEENLTVEKTKQLVNKIINHIEEKEIFQKEKKNIRIDIELEENALILKFNDPLYRDIANNYILSRLEAIKKEILDSL